MKKTFFILIILFLILATTITKNSTNKLDKEIFETKENIRLLKDKYELVLLEHNYLSSPTRLMQYQSLYFENELLPIDIEKTGKIIFNNEMVIFEEYMNGKIEKE